MWSKVERHEFPGSGNVIETLDSQPKRLCPRLCIAFAAEKATEASYHADGFSKCGRLIRRFWILSDQTIQGFPLGFLKENRARHIRGLASELGQVKDTPSHDHVDSQARLNAIGIPQLALFDLATAFQRAVIDFNAPAFGIPAKLLHGLIKVFNGHRREQHPLKRLYPLGTVDLLSQNRGDIDFFELKLSTRGSQLHSPKAHLQASLSGGALTLTRHADDFSSGH